MRHRWSLVVLGASLGVGALTHCSLVNDLDALGAGSGDGGSGADVRAIGNTDSGTGATLDAATPADDAGEDADAAKPTADAGPDTADTAPPNAPPTFVDAGATTFCSAHTSSTFCADFDEAPLPAGFTSTEGAFISLTSTNPSSRPNDFLLNVPPQNGVGVLASKVTRSFPRSATGADVAFDLDPEKLNTSASGLLIAALEFTSNPAAKYSVRLAFNQGAIRVEESYLAPSPADIFHSVFSLAPGQWSRIRLELRFGADGGPSTLGVYVNDVLQGSKDALTPPLGMDGRPTLLLGAVYGSLPHDGWTLRYDNVLLDLL